MIPLLLLLVQSQADDCTWLATGIPNVRPQAMYDLSGLRRPTDDFDIEDSTFRYKVNVCGAVNEPGKCATSSICALWLDGGAYFGSLGFWHNKLPLPTWELLDNANVEAGVSIVFQNGGARCKSTPLTTILRIECKPDSLSILKSVENDWHACVLTLTFESKHGCPVREQPASSGHVGIGAGALTAILLFTVVPAAYLVLGMLWRRRQGHTGWQMCPNRTFWLACPGRTYFACHWICSRCRRNTRSYDSLGDGDGPVTIKTIQTPETQPPEDRREFF